MTWSEERMYILEDGGHSLIVQHNLENGAILIRHDGNDAAGKVGVASENIYALTRLLSDIVEKNMAMEKDDGKPS